MEMRWDGLAIFFSVFPFFFLFARILYSGECDTNQHITHSVSSWRVFLMLFYCYLIVSGARKGIGWKGKKEGKGERRKGGMIKEGQYRAGQILKKGIWVGKKDGRSMLNSNSFGLFHCAPVVCQDTWYHVERGSMRCLSSKQASERVSDFL
ncbi:hypothetical protein N658DRAFT_499656 [Parathielavia hyrcaniae]|uniref:Uncharacterized protein n=1 Tax=Parathielavia hyrcaniae TaxID=113614 RepID=A0AAN6SYN2_9PEZI|nr:hypothetical protein N658DRAFT_499656 [Parathielavia hyrcaniae]